MKSPRPRFFERFLAFLIILSVTFSQVISPAYALRTEQSPDVRVGLEEALHQGAPVAEAGAVVARAATRGIPAAAIADVDRRLRELPPGKRNTRDMVLEAVELLRRQAVGRPVDAIPTADAVAQQLEDLIRATPNLDCPVCGAKLAHALISDPFSDPRKELPEHEQGERFNELETLNAMLLALGVVHQGRIVTLTNSQDGHQMPGSTLADLRDLIHLMEHQPGFPEEARHEWTGARMSQAQVERALDEGQVVLAHVGGEHFVRILEISHGQVTYTEPQISYQDRNPTPGIAVRPIADFMRWWKRDARSHTTGTVLLGTRPGQEVKVESRLNDDQMAGVIGCCGINAMFGNFRSIRRILDAVLRLKYRAPDDTGIMVITRHGLVVLKVQGAPDTLILEMMDRPILPEMLPLNQDPEQNRKDLAEHRKTRLALLADEGVTEWQSAGPWDLAGKLFDIFNSDIETLYAGTQIGMGVVGGVWAGWVYTLDRGDNEGMKFRAMGGPEIRLIDMINRWDLSPEFIKLFMRKTLMARLPAAPADPTRVQILADFDRLGDRALKRQLEADEQARWDQIWSEYLQGQNIVIPPEFNRDPVRHVFRLLDQLVGSFREHPEWENEVQEIFNRYRPNQKHPDHWIWRTYWEHEYRYNMPGLAWSALVEWVQDFLLREKIVPATIHGRWLAARSEQSTRFGFSLGLVDREFLLAIPEIILGHGRWAMTGDPNSWNGHPQTTESRAVVHNGAVEGDKNSELKDEHQERFEELMKQAADFRQRQRFEVGVVAIADAMEQRARRNYGKYEDLAQTEEIVTDTRTIVRQWQLIADVFKADVEAGLVTSQGRIDVSKPGRLNRLGVTGELGRPVFDRAGAWNRVVDNLRNNGIENPNPDEVALRVALMEMAPGSEIAIDGFSLATPFTEFVASHDRPVDIVVHQVKDRRGSVIYENYMVTSDARAGVGLFPAAEVNAGAQELATLEREMLEEIRRLRASRREHHMDDDEFGRGVERVIARFEQGVDQVKRRFVVEVYHLKGPDKFSRITRRVDDGGQQRVEVRIDRLTGEPLQEKDAEMLNRKTEFVNPGLGDKGRYESYMQKHVDEIPLITLRQALRSIRRDGGQAFEVVLDAVLAGDTVPEVLQDEDGLHTRLAEAPIQRHGLNPRVLLRHFGGAGLEEVTEASALGMSNLKRIILVGVGSSWRDALNANLLFEDLLPGVEIVVYDPVEIQNQGVELNPESDLIVGMSWSGETSSMVRLFNRLQDDGFVTVTVTGTVNSGMGRLSERSGGTLDVLSGDELSVATTKGFEAVLYQLDLLAVQLSELRGNPEVADFRAQIVQDLRRVPDLLYEILTEEETPKGSRQLDVEDENSAINLLAQKYVQRRKLLWIGSRNVPIHVEGELKGEEVVSSKDKPSLMGIAMDIEDSSWHATITHNTDPKAPERDRTIVGFDMTDPLRMDVFIQEIRALADFGADFSVLTYEEGNDYFEELQAIAAASEGRIQLFRVPRVHARLQALINAPFYFRFALASARARKMPPHELDNSRNLAKSVTVSYAQQLKELLRLTKTKVVSLVHYAVQAAVNLGAALKAHIQRIKGRVWGMYANPRARAIQRLPVMLQAQYDLLFSDRSWMATGADREKVEGALGSGLQGLKQIVIVTDEESTENAALASMGPLGSRETVYSDSKDKELYDPKIGVPVPIKGYYHRVTYDRRTNTYQIAPNPAYEQNRGLPQPPSLEPVVVSPDTGECMLNGYRYQVDPTSFMRDKKQKENLAFGLTLRATEPDLLGVTVKTMRASDLSLDREAKRTDTLFILISRSNNLHQQNHRIAPISGTGPDATRTAADWTALDGVQRRPETAMVWRAEQLQAAGGRFISFCDANSAIAGFGRNAGLGMVELLGDNDDTSLYSLTYMGLLAIGVRLGAVRGVQTERYQQGLRAVPDMVADILRDTELRKRLDAFIKQFARYMKLQIVGGGQAYADALEYARVLRMLGIFAEAQRNDSMWHGPLAAYDPNRAKFADPARKLGFNEAFDPADDTLGLVLMSDYKFFGTALGGDGQVLDSRNARFGLVTKKSDRNLNAVQKVGAAPNGIFPLADFPDELGNFANAVAANYFAMRFAEAHADALGRPIPPPAGGLAPPRAVAEEEAAFREFAAGSLHGIQLPAPGALVDSIAALHTAYRQQGRPQVAVLPHPTDENRAVLAVVDRDRARLSTDTYAPLSNYGINFSSTISRHFRGAALVLVDVERSVDALTRTPDSDVERVQRNLLGAHVPPSFQEAFRLYETTMPGNPLRFLYGAYRQVQEIHANTVTISQFVPQPENQSAIVVVVPVADRFADLDQRVRAALAQQGLEVITPAEVRYQETEQHRPVLFLRYTVNANARNENVTRAIARIEGMVAELPRFLQPQRDVVDALIRQYGIDQMVRFQALPGPEPDQTILIISGSDQQTGVLTVLTDALNRAGIPILPNPYVGIYMPDGVGVAYVVARASLAELQRVRGKREPLEERSVLQDVHNRVQTQYLSNREMDLYGRLSKQDFTPDQIAWFQKFLRNYFEMVGQRRPLTMQLEMYEVHRVGGVRITAVAAMCPLAAQAQTFDLEAGLRKSAVAVVKKADISGLSVVVDVLPDPQAAIVLLTWVDLPKEDAERHRLPDAVAEELRKVAPKSGLEELTEGDHYRFDADKNVVFLRPVDIRTPVALANGVTLNPEGSSIVVGGNSLIYKGATVKGTVVIGRNSEAGGILVGTADKPLVIGHNVKIHRPQADVKRSIVGSNTVINGADVSDATLVSVGSGDARTHTTVDVGTVLEHGVAMGAEIGTNVKLYEDWIVGPHTKELNLLEADAILLWGALPDAGVNFRHQGYMGSFLAVPVVVGAEPFTNDYYQAFRKAAEAIVLGRLIKVEPAEAAPISGTGIQWNATYDVNGSQRVVAVHRINFGAGTTTSDYNPLTGGKGSGSALAGVATGVHSVLKAPVLLDQRALVGSLSQADGELSLGTVLVGVLKHRDLDGASAYLKSEGYRALTRGFTLGEGVSKEVAVQMDYFRKLRIMAEVFAQAARQAADPETLAGYAASVRAVYKQWGWIAPRYTKVLQGALDLSIENLRKGKGGPKLEEQEALLTQREPMLQELKDLEAAIRTSADSMAPITQPAVADWMRQDVLQSGVAWQSPLADQTGLEEMPPLQRIVPALPPAVELQAARTPAAFATWVQAELDRVGPAFAPSALLDSPVLTVVDLSDRPENAIAATGLIEAGATVIVQSRQAYTTAVMLTLRGWDAKGVIFLDEMPGSNEAERLRAALGAVVQKIAAVPGLKAHLYSGRDPGAFQGLPAQVEVKAPWTLGRILQALKASVEFVRWIASGAFEELSVRWRQLEEHYV